MRHAEVGDESNVNDDDDDDDVKDDQHVVITPVCLYLDVILSLLIQAWAAQSEEERGGRRAQMRDHTAEVLHKSNHDD